MVTERIAPLPSPILFEPKLPKRAAEPTATLSKPEMLVDKLELPTATLLHPVVFDVIEFAPIDTFESPVVLAHKAKVPIAVFPAESNAVQLVLSASEPTAVLHLPETLDRRDLVPIATLVLPTVLHPRDRYPTPTLAVVEVEPKLDFIKDWYPTATLKLPVLLHAKAQVPIAMLRQPVVV